MPALRTMVLPALAALALVTGCAPGYVATGVDVEARLGPGVALYQYDAIRDGEWRSSYRQWTPVVVYELNGTYYPTKVRGGRQVQVYRYQSSYFLPPRDQEWRKADRRYNTRKAPTDADYGRARRPE